MRGSACCRQGQPRSKVQPLEWRDALFDMKLWCNNFEDFLNALNTRDIALKCLKAFISNRHIYERSDLKLLKYVVSHINLFLRQALHDIVSSTALSLWRGK